MSDWSLPKLLAGLHDRVQQDLSIARESFAHAGTKGDASEGVWVELLQKYLPQRYQVATAHVVDNHGCFSEQIDVVIYDRQYSPLIFEHKGQLIVPAESVYAVFEAKQVITADYIDYAQKKVATVRNLDRTSLPVPWVGGEAKPKPLHRILGGLLTFESDWKPPLGQPLLDALARGDATGRLDLGCVAAHGLFGCDKAGCNFASPQGKPATAFLLELIARLQSLATVPMINVRAYARWLT